MSDIRSTDAEAGFGIDRAAPVNAPVFEPAVEWVADHRLDADGVDVDVDRDPAVGLPAPDAVGIRTARIDVLTLHFTAERPNQVAICAAIRPSSIAPERSPAFLGPTLEM